MTNPINEATKDCFAYEYPQDWFTTTEKCGHVEFISTDSLRWAEEVRRANEITAVTLYDANEIRMLTLKNQKELDISVAAKICCAKSIHSDEHYQDRLVFMDVVTHIEKIQHKLSSIRIVDEWTIRLYEGVEKSEVGKYTIITKNDGTFIGRYDYEKNELIFKS